MLVDCNMKVFFTITTAGWATESLANMFFSMAVFHAHSRRNVNHQPMISLRGHFERLP